MAHHQPLPPYTTVLPRTQNNCQFCMYVEMTSLYTNNWQLCMYVETTSSQSSAALQLFLRPERCSPQVSIESQCPLGTAPTLARPGALNAKNKKKRGGSYLCYAWFTEAKRPIMMTPTTAQAPAARSLFLSQ